ncbi:MAG: hypothetical protein NTX86_00175 [Candidatus Dependentiae bacterium]|nr:hypothetical protein [Candidatus Dependentiae bacterium]
MFNKIKNIAVIFLLLYGIRTRALIVGSLVAPLRQGTVTFPTGASNNQMLGFTDFEGGFTLTDAVTTLSFNAYFPVSYLMNMRGGIVNLVSDMNLTNSFTSFVSTGTINGSGFSITTPYTEQFPFIMAMDTPNVTPYDNHYLLTTTNFSVDSSVGDAYTVVALAQTTPGIYILQFNQSTFAITQLATANTPGSCTSARWHPTLLYLAVANATTGSGSVQTYLFTPPSTLTLQGTITSGTNAFAVSWHPSGNYLAAGFSNGIKVYSFNSTTGALTLLSSDVQTQSVLYNALSWSSDGKYVVAGYTTTAAFNELRVDSFNGATLTPVASYRIGSSVNACEWSPIADFISVGLVGTANTLRMFSFNRSTNTLTDLTTAYVGQTNGVYGTSWSPDGQSIVIVLNLTTTQTLQIYNFNPYALVQSLVSANVLAPNGLFSIRWSRNGMYVITGDLEIEGNYVSYYTASVPYYLINLKIIMNSNMVMYGMPTFQGNCIIDGNGYTLDVSHLQNFTISSGATLQLKDMNLYGVSGTRVQCTDSTGVLQLRDMTLTQTGNYTFANGAFTIQGDVLFTGTSNFIYSSSKTSTINSNATLTFDNFMTFSYAPSVASNSLLAMTDNTSSLNLLNTSLFVSTAGLRLTRGNLMIEGLCGVSSAATNSSQGIFLGDGVSSANNLTTMVLEESGLKLQSGFLVYQNV